MRRLALLSVGIFLWGAFVPSAEASVSVPQDSIPVDGSTVNTEVPSGVENTSNGGVSELPRGDLKRMLPPEVQEFLRQLATRRSEVGRRLGAQGSETPATGFVVGGEEAVITEAPWQVFLAAGIQYIESDPTSFVYEFFCGGSIIDEEWILTAAHCVSDARVYPYLHVGSGVTSNKGLTSDNFVRVSEVVLHPDWDYFQESDIALLRLSEPIELSAVRAVIELPTEVSPSWPEIGTVGMVTGWGYIAQAEAYVLPEKLHKGEVLVLADPGSPECGLLNAFDGGFNPETMLCAGKVLGGTDTCQGDSGGPLAIEVEGTQILAGITSWGYGCAEYGFPGVYTRVTTFVSWVESITKSPRGLPIITSISGRNRSLVVNVDVSGLGGGEPTNFQYRLDRGRWTSVNPVDADGEFVIGNLRNGRSYSVRVRAVNDFGRSESSAPKSGVAGLPSVPMNVTVTPGDRRLLVSFAKPESDGGSRLLSYEYSLNGGESWKTVSSTRSPITIGNLKNGVPYSVVIRARNIFGPGPSSAPTSGTPNRP